VKSVFTSPGWAYAHVCDGAVIGEDCNLCDRTFFEKGVRLGNRVTIKCGVMPPISNLAFPFSPKVGRVTPSAHPCSSVVELLFPG
jgi:hypothetical protein